MKDAWWNTVGYTSSETLVAEIKPKNPSFKKKHIKFPTVISNTETQWWPSNITPAVHDHSAYMYVYKSLELIIWHLSKFYQVIAKSNLNYSPKYGILYHTILVFSTTTSWHNIRDFP